MAELNVKNYFKFMEEVEKFFYEQLSQPTAKHYKQIAEHFFEWLLGTCEKIELTSIFTVTNLKKYRDERKSNIVRSVHIKLLEFMFEKKYISNEEFYKFKENVLDVECDKGTFRLSCLLIRDILKKTGGEIRNGKTSARKKHNRHLPCDAERSGWA